MEKWRGNKTETEERGIQEMLISRMIAEGLGR